MKQIRITINFLKMELIPTFSKPDYRTYCFNWLFIDAYILLNKKK